MIRPALFVALSAGLLCAQAPLLPDALNGAARTRLPETALADRPVWDEYGLQQVEADRYAGPSGPFTATAYRFRDSTGAYAAYLWQRPAGAKPLKLAPFAAGTASETVLTAGNYLLRFSGHQPTAAEVQAVTATLPRLDGSPAPPLSRDLPAAGRVAGSERYILGPVSLAQFAPSVSPSLAAFHFGTEGIVAQYSAPATTLAVFAYPSPHIARERITAFQALPQAVTKRSGPLVAVTLAAAEPNQVERLLAQVHYDAELTEQLKIPKKEPNPGVFLLAVFSLTGFLIVGFLGSGIVFGLLFYLFRSYRPAVQDAFLTLHLRD